MIIELAVVVSLAAGLGIVARLFKQPAILAYLATGAIIAASGFFEIAGHETFEAFSGLGIMFLLFLVGLEINYSSLKLVGKTSVLVGLGQIVFTAGIGYAISRAFGYGALEGAYIAIALTFSSTIIIVKLLSEKKDLSSLYGKIAIGFMLVQDVVAVVILIALSGIENSASASLELVFYTAVRGVALLIVMLWLGRSVLPFIFDRIARSHELLFVSSLAWVFVVSAVVTKFGFSVEIGGFLAGIALANSAEHFQIASRIKSLRDFFILIFFVILGSSLVLFDFSGLTFKIIVFSLFVLIGNPLIVLAIMGAMGYRHRTSFLAGVTVAQISEFSLILASIGLRVGHVSETVVALITAVGVVTITLSTYLIMYADHVAKRIKPFLQFFERNTLIEERVPDEEYNMPIVLIGAGRTGEGIAYHLPPKKLLVIDFNPDVVRHFRSMEFTALLGDIADEDIFEKANIEDAKLVISTSPDVDDNLALLERINKLKSGRRKVIVRATSREEAEILYEAGAQYVIYPHLTTGHYLGKNIGEDVKVGFLSALKKHDRALIRSAKVS